MAPIVIHIGQRRRWGQRPVSVQPPVELNEATRNFLTTLAIAHHQPTSDIEKFNDLKPGEVVRKPRPSLQETIQKARRTSESE